MPSAGAAGRPDLGDRAGDVALANARRRQLGPFARQRRRRRTAEPEGAAGDRNDPIVDAIRRCVSISFKVVVPYLTLAAVAAGVLTRVKARSSISADNSFQFYRRQTRQETLCARASHRPGRAAKLPEAEIFAPLGGQSPQGADPMKVKGADNRRAAALRTPTDLGSNATRDVSAALNLLLADVFTLYMKTKNFHWHMSGPHFRDYHLLLDEQADQIFAMTDAIAERVRKVGGQTLRSIGHVARTQRLADSDADYVAPLDMLAELRDDNQRLAASLREAHGVCDEAEDFASASLIEVWIDETERRTWFLFEASRRAEEPGR
jgi:starvation-inducible DNA-binding protein